ncbi:MAG: restriction endonuclease [Clostridia bacterium]|nr:restriction endonuclease [Clostridia bacterium]
MYIFIGLIVGLILIIYLYILISRKINAPREKLRNELYQQKLVNSKLEKNLVELKYEINLLKNCIIEKDELFNSLKLRDNESVSKITSLYSDFLLCQYEISSHCLKNKPHPATKEVLRIKSLKRITETHLMQFRHMMYKYEMLLQLFPELSNYVDDFDSIKQLENIESIESLQENYDRVQMYVSKEEYSRLSIDDRNQLALDRYINGQKTKWQIGRDYELYCGREYEEEGWEVEYIGMEKKLNDMGRDLIAIKGNTHLVIQCKNWKQGNLIHEKHITQLFGTTIEYGMNMPEHIIVKPVFITNIQLSDSAKRFANKLGVIIRENFPLEEFPRIKCNINRNEYGSESKIYHLPFDQQYDRTKISKEGEFYALTVKEAVSAGFRRAFKYYG